MYAGSRLCSVTGAFYVNRIDLASKLVRFIKLIFTPNVTIIAVQPQNRLFLSFLVKRLLKVCRPANKVI